VRDMAMERKNTCTVILYYETERHADASESKNFHHLTLLLLLCLSLSLATLRVVYIHNHYHCLIVKTYSEIMKKKCEWTWQVKIMLVFSFGRALSVSERIVYELETRDCFTSQVLHFVYCRWVEEKSLLLLFYFTYANLISLARLLSQKKRAMNRLSIETVG
jgi:hypothetical protein